MESIHRVLAYAAVAGAAAGVVWSLASVLWSPARNEAFVLFQAAVVSLLVVAAASGLLLFVSGPRPADGLHLLYALVAIAIVPLARSFLTRSSYQRSAALYAVAFVVLGGVLYRLFTTG